MKLIVRLLWLCLFPIIAYSFCLAQETDQESGPPLAAAIEYVSDNWKEFSPATGGYTILMPGTPAFSKQETSLGSLPYAFYSLKTGAVDYQVGYFELPGELSDPQQAKTVLDAMRMQMLAANKSFKLLSEREFKIEGQEAREWLIKDGDKIVRKRYFIHGKRFYQLTLTVSRNTAFKTGKPSDKPSDRTDFYQTTAAKFFDSLKLIPLSEATTASSSDQPGAGKTIITSGIITGRAVEKPAPSYPSAAKSAGVQGTVEVQVIVDEKGRVVEAKAISGHPLLRDEAVKAARRARFSPTKLPDGSAVKVSGTLTYNFILH